MEQQLPAILGADHLMAAANDERAQVEALFNLCRDRYPDDLALRLAHIFHNSPRLELRAISAALLRQQLASDLWPRLPPTTHSDLKSLLLAFYQREDMEQQLAAILEADLAAILKADQVADLAPFEALVSHLMAAANGERAQGEFLFNLCRDRHPDVLARCLARILHASPHQELRAMSAVLLRMQLASGLWPRLAPTTHSDLKVLLFASVQREASKSVAKKLCDAVSVLAAMLLPDNAWPELHLFMFQSVTSDSSRLQESRRLIFSQLAQYRVDILLSHLSTLQTVFITCLSSSAALDVRIAALGAAINFIQCLPSPSDLDRFQDLLPAMMRTLTEALSSWQEATAQEALVLLVDLASTKPEFFCRQLAVVVSSMLQIAEADSLEEGTRHLAVEVVIILAEAPERAPDMMRRLPQFVERLFLVLVKMLLNIDDDPAWHTAKIEDEDAGETSNYGMGKECLARLSIALGVIAVVPVASELLPAYLAAPEWQKHHAALITLAHIAKGSSRVMINNLEQVISMVLNSLHDQHPRVRWAAINAIGHLSTDLRPDLQNQYHHPVLSALASAMDDFQNPRVQARAASAIANFIENCTVEIWLPYSAALSDKIDLLRENGNQMVREAACTAFWSMYIFRPPPECPRQSFIRKLSTKE